jgi:hypothetical protein
MSGIELVTDRSSWVVAKVENCLLIACQIHFRSRVRSRRVTSQSLIRASCLRNGCLRANRITNKGPTEYPYVFFCPILLVIPTFRVSDRTEMATMTSHMDPRYYTYATTHLDTFPIICAVWYKYNVASSTVFLPKSMHNVHVIHKLLRWCQPTL